MRRTLSILLISFLLVGVAAPFFAVPVTAATPGDPVTPGVGMTGILTDADPEDYWGIELTVGTYNFSVHSTNGSVTAYLYAFINGWALLGEVKTETSNDSTIVVINPGSLNTLPSRIGEGQYQIKTEKDDAESGTVVYYTVTMDRLPDLGVMQTNQTTQLILDRPANRIQWLAFNATGSLNAYNVSTAMNKSVTMSFTCYNVEGLKVYDISSSVNDTSHVLLLDPGLYYVAIKHSLTGAVKLWIKATPLRLETIEPGDTITFTNKTGATSAYYQLSIPQGHYFGMNLAPTAGLEVAFIICLGPTDVSSVAIVVDDWPTGRAENLTDLVFFGTNTAYVDWDRNLTGGWERSRLRTTTQVEGETLDPSRLILVIEFAGEGNATFSMSNGTPVPTLTPGSSVEASLNNTAGPLWAIYRITDLTPDSGYDLRIAHTPLPDQEFTTTYKIYRSMATINEVLINTMPLHSEANRGFWVFSMVSMGEDYDDYTSGSVRKQYLFTSIPLDQYLLIRVPDAVIGAAYTGVPLLAGTLNVSLAPIDATPLAVGSPVTITPGDSYPSFFTMSLTPDHLYQVRVTAVNASSGVLLDLLDPLSDMNPMVYNGSGYPLNAYTRYDIQTSPDPRDRCTVYMSFQAKGAAGQFTLVLPAYGDGPLTVEIRDVTPANIFGSTMLILTTAGATAAAGIIIGFLAAKAKYA